MFFIDFHLPFWDGLFTVKYVLLLYALLASYKITVYDVGISDETPRDSEWTNLKLALGTIDPHLEAYRS